MVVPMKLFTRVSVEGWVPCPRYSFTEYEPFPACADTRPFTATVPRTFWYQSGESMSATGGTSLPSAVTIATAAAASTLPQPVHVSHPALYLYWEVPVWGSSDEAP